MSIFSIIISSDFISKVILLVLLTASIVSWALIIERMLLYKKVVKKISDFDKTFWISRSIDEVYESAKVLDNNPLSLVFVGAMEEWKKPSAIASDFVLTSTKERILNSMTYIKNLELSKLEKNLYVLALFGSKAPFIGLLGTVWGIMHSFHAISISKNTSINIVAPGVAEALLVTAIGLWVAIPALVFYNFFLARSSYVEVQIDYFIGRLYNLFSTMLDDKSTSIREIR